MESWESTRVKENGFDTASTYYIYYVVCYLGYFTEDQAGLILRSHVFVYMHEWVHVLASQFYTYIYVHDELFWVLEESKSKQGKIAVNFTGMVYYCL